MNKLARLLPQKQLKNGDEDEANQSPAKGPSSVQPTPPQPSQQDPAVISFIPMTIDRSPLPILERPKEVESPSTKIRPQSSSDDAMDTEKWALFFCIS
jgi:hypothetical protein